MIHDYNENFPKKTRSRYFFSKEMMNHFPKEVGQYYPKLFSYSDCIKDQDGFIDSSKYLPLLNDIVLVEIERKGEKLSKIYTAWWTGTYWDGARISSEDKILRWKKKEDGCDY